MALVNVPIPLTNNQVKFYHHEVLQKLNAEDINKISGASLIDSAYAELLKSMQLLLAKSNSKVFFGFKIQNQSANSFDITAGIVLTTTGIYQFPGATFNIPAESLRGKIEFRLQDSFGDPVPKQFFNLNSKTFQPELGNSRKIHTFLINNTYETLNVEPANSVYFETLATYRRNAPGQPLNSVSHSVEILNTGEGLKGSMLEPNSIPNQSLSPDIKIGSLAQLEAAFTGAGRTSAVGALNFLWAFVEAKNFIRTVPGSGFDNGIFRVRTVGNLAYWDKGDGNFRPFA